MIYSLISNLRTTLNYLEVASDEFLMWLGSFHLLVMVVLFARLVLQPVRDMDTLLGREPFDSENEEDSSDSDSDSEEGPPPLTSDSEES